MGSKYAFILAAATLILGSATVSLAAVVSLEPIGNVVNVPWAISQNGDVVVGQLPGGEAYLWTRAGGVIGLGDLPGGGFHSEAFDVSADGSVVVGYGTRAPTWVYEAFRWTEATGMIGLGHVPGGSFDSVANAVSADGSVVVGRSNTPWGDEAFHWTKANGMVGLGNLLGGGGGSEALDVSADGRVVVGWSLSAGNFLEAFRWTEADGMVGIGGSSGEGTMVMAIAVSADGSAVVGHGLTSSGAIEAFRWTQAGGAVSLGCLPGESESEVRDLSDDGSVTIGMSGGSPFYWTETSGMQDFRDVLRDCGLDLTEWWFYETTAVSADGLTVLGVGAYRGQDVAWMATIPEPATLLLLGLGVVMLRRKR